MSLFTDDGMYIEVPQGIRRLDELEVDQAPTAHPASAAAPAGDDDANSDVADDDIVAALALREPFEIVAELPSEFRGTEGRGMLHDPYLKTPVGDAQLVHGEYRGSDSSRFRELRVRSTEAAILLFYDQKNPDTGACSTAGKFPAQPTMPGEKKEKASIRVSYLTATQFTGVRLHISIPGTNNEVQCKIFGDSIMKVAATQQVGHSSGFFMKNPSDEDLGPLFGHSELIKYARAGNLLYTHLKMNKPGSGVKRPSFTGISERQIQALSDRYDNDDTRSNLQEHERIIVLLHRTQFLGIHRRLTDDSRDISGRKRKAEGEGASNEDEEVLKLNPKPFVDYFMSAIWLNVIHGALWFNKLQAPGMSLMDRNFPLDSIAVPRWLVKKWRIFKDDEGKIKSFEPHEWTPLGQVLEYPDAESCAFLHSLAITREAQFQRNSIRQMITPDDGALTAFFRQTVSLPGQYLVDIYAPGELTRSGNWKNLKPAVDTQLRIVVTDPRFKCTLRGQVTDDMLGREGGTCDFVAGVTGPVLEFPNEAIGIEVQLLSDPTTTNRALNAIESISQGVTRKAGVDLCRDLLGAPATIPGEDIAELANTLGRQSLVAALDRLDKNYDLNHDQAAAAKSYITDPYSLIWGPAGNGKTKTLVTSVNELATLGVKQVVACQTNRAVDKALGDILELNPQLRAVRYIAGFRHNKTAKRPSNDTTAVDADNTSKTTLEVDEQWQMFLDQLDLKGASHQLHLFDVKKLENIREIAANDKHAENWTAKEYLQLRDDLSKAKSSEKRVIRMKLDAVDEPLNKHFLEHCVDVVFVTCASALNDELAPFKPEVITIDEAGQATLADICMATARFKESVLSLNLTGDYVQLGPVVIAKACNEALTCLNRSHFESHVKDGQEHWPHHMLKEHYRSHPDIIAFPNEAFYHGLIQNAPKTCGLQPIQKTLRQFFAALGPAWNQKWRIGIDVSEGSSKLFGNTKSMYNDAEAELIVDLILKMVEFEPDHDGILPEPPKITLGDIGVFTAYKGQVRTITRKLNIRGLNPRGLKLLGTTASVRGGDAPIGITSGVSRKPDDVNKGLRYTGHSKTVAVNTTRSRYLDIYVANFSPAVQLLAARKADANSYLTSAQMSHYRKLIEHLHNSKSIISSSDIDRGILSKEPKRVYTSNFRITHDYDLMKTAKNRSGKNLNFRQREGRGQTLTEGHDTRGNKRNKQFNKQAPGTKPNRRANTTAETPAESVETGVETQPSDLTFSARGPQEAKKKLKDAAKRFGLSTRVYKKRKRDGTLHEAEQKPLLTDENML